MNNTIEEVAACTLGLLVGVMLMVFVWLNLNIPRTTLTRLLETGDTACAQYGGLHSADLTGEWVCEGGQRVKI